MAQDCMLGVARGSQEVAMEVVVEVTDNTKS